MTEGTAAEFTLTRTATGTALTVAVSVTEDGVVISGTAPVEVAFAEDAATATLTVATDADTVAETSSVVTATVAAGTGYRVGTPATAAVTVHDDDRLEVTVGFMSPLLLILGEGGQSPREIVLAFDPVPDRAVTIPVVRTDGPGAVAGDLSGDPGSVTFDPALGATNTSFTVMTINDDIAEHDEVVFFAIGGPLPDGVQVDPARSRMRVRIVDNDGIPPDNRAPEITTTTTVFEIAENSPRGTAIGEAIEATDADLDYLHFDLQGLDGDKFTIEERTGQIRTLLTIPGYDYDHEAEPFHSVTVRVRDIIGNSAANGASDTLDVTINVTDVDEPPSAPATPAVKPTRGSGTSLDVSWEAPANAGKPAIESYDLRYREEGGSWEDGPQDVTATTTAMIAGLTEGTDYEVQVRATNDEGDGPWSDSASGRPVALPEVTIAKDKNAVNENEGTAGFTLSRTGSTAAALTVKVEVTQEADRDLLPDGAAAERTVTFAVGSATAALSVALENDDLYEAPGILTVEVQPGTGYTVGSPGSVTMTVIDTDRELPTPANLSASVGTGPGEVVLSWDPYAANLSISWHEYRYKTDGTYGNWTEIPHSGQQIALMGTEVGSANLTGWTVTGLVGGVEHTFEVRTTAPANRVSAASNEDSATPRSAAVSYGAATYSVDEGATVEVTVSLSGAPGREVTVPVAAAGGGGATGAGRDRRGLVGGAGDRDLRGDLHRADLHADGRPRTRWTTTARASCSPSGRCRRGWRREL